ncbi:hypothetical protein INR49_014392 [Caranx melampygus]|nr:hypothetical protein INR49_014392 [Caranx melampygus]
MEREPWERVCSQFGPMGTKMMSFPPCPETRMDTAKSMGNTRLYCWFCWRQMKKRFHKINTTCAKIKDKTEFCQEKPAAEGDLGSAKIDDAALSYSQNDGPSNQFMMEDPTSSSAPCHEVIHFLCHFSLVCSSHLINECGKDRGAQFAYRPSCSTSLAAHTVDSDLTFDLKWRRIHNGLAKSKKPLSPDRLQQPSQAPPLVQITRDSVSWGRFMLSTQFHSLSTDSSANGTYNCIRDVDAEDENPCWHSHTQTCPVAAVAVIIVEAEDRRFNAPKPKETGPQ